MKAEKINQLIALCNSTSKQYEKAIYLASEPALKEFFMEGIMVNATAIQQLKGYLRSERLQIEPKKDYTAFLYRAIMIIRSAINNNAHIVLLEECYKADKRMIKAFEKVWLKCKECDPLKEILLGHINMVDKNVRSTSFSTAKISELA